MRVSDPKRKAYVPTRETATIMMVIAIAIATLVAGVVEVHRFVVAALDGSPEAGICPMRVVKSHRLGTGDSSGRIHDARAGDGK
jgi:hypothetical protein